ncbi:unnamed protein product [Meloidogyne enterolobii]
MNDEARLAVLHAHNKYRSKLACGEVTDASNKTLPGGIFHKFVSFLEFILKVMFHSDLVVLAFSSLIMFLSDRKSFTKMSFIETKFGNPVFHKESRTILYERENYW